MPAPPETRRRDRMSSKIAALSACERIADARPLAPSTLPCGRHGSRRRRCWPAWQAIRINVNSRREIECSQACDAKAMVCYEQRNRACINCEGDAVYGLAP